jgi:hypothetical protein
MLGDFGYLGRQLLRFSVATFAVICAVMIVWWSMTPDAALDRRSVSARAKEDLQIFHNSQSINSRDVRTSPLGAFDRSLDQLGTKLSDAWNRMTGRDKQAVAIREQGLRGLFNSAPQSARVQDNAPAGRAIVRGLSAEEAARVQNHGRESVAARSTTAFEPEPAAEPSAPAAPAAPAKGKKAPAKPDPRSKSADLRGTIAPAPAPVRSAAVVGERTEFNTVNAALAVAEDDYRAFPQALEQVQGFLERYPSSSRRQQFANRIDALAALRNRAEDERSKIDAESVLTPVDFSDTDLAGATACLHALTPVRAVAIAAKAVIVQRHIPAHFIVADAGYAKMPPEAVTREMKNATAESIGKCIPRLQAAGSLVVTFWPDSDAMAAAQAMAKIEGAFVYGRP